MGQPVSASAAGVQNSEGVPGASKVSLNTRARTATDYVGLLSDVLQFTGASPVGNWILGSARVTVNGVPVITQASAGTSYSATGPTGPMRVAMGDARVSAL